jgi:hypothetical protein
MTHPERSRYASEGPEGAVGGWDHDFLREPGLRRAGRPSSRDLPGGWAVEPWLMLASRELASRLGY